MLSEKSFRRQSQKYYVSETFYTIQGEGPSLGEPAFFIRMQGCDVGCEVCDTKYTWPYNTGQHLSVEEIVEQVRASREASSFRLVVITGGEPMDQPLGDLCDALLNLSPVLRIEIETSGKCPPDFERIKDARIQYNLSPKLGAMRAKLNTHNHLTAFNQHTNAIFKFVVGSDSDIVEVINICQTLNIGYGRVFLMPEGLTPDKIQARHTWLADVVKRLGNGIRMTTRFHILTWGPKRGV